MNKSTFKNEQKWTALLVAITFSWLLHASTMPLTADSETEQPRPEVVDRSIQSDAEQAPGFVEELSPDWNRPAKLKITTVLIIVGALLVLGIINVFFRGIGHEAAPREATSASEANRFLTHPNRT